MKKLIFTTVASLCLLLIAPRYLHAEWIEDKEPVMKGVGWFFPAVHGDKFIFDTGGAPSAGKDKAGSYLYEADADRITFLTHEKYGPKALYGDRFVTQAGGNILLFEIGRSGSTQIGIGRSAPDMDSKWIVYESGGEIVTYNIKNTKEKRVQPLGMVVTNQEFGPTVWGDTVYWLERTDEGRGVIVSYSMMSDRVKHAKELPAGILINMQTLRARDGILLIANKKDVYIYNIETGKLKLISRSGSRQFASGINNGLVFWDSDGGATVNLYDIAKDEYTAIQSKGSSIYSVAAFKDKVLFLDYNRYELRKFNYKQE